jgi:SAM-dependent methyltransferase
MSAEPIIGNIHRLSVHVEALAALGAALRLQQSGADADPRVGSRLQRVIHSIDPRLAEGAALSQGGNAVPLIQTVFRQAIELLENPERAPGWRHEDKSILQSQGLVSRHIAHSIDAQAQRCPSLRAVLRRPGTLLDVGTGAGWLAIEAARIWPTLRVVGIDVSEPALAMARENIARSQFADRIELRTQAVEQLDDASVYTAAFFPGPFIAPEITRDALDRVCRALVPAGWLIFALWAAAEDPLAAAVANLRIVRSGGHPWASTEVEDLLRAADFARIEALPNEGMGSPLSFVIGQRDKHEEQRIWTS